MPPVKVGGHCCRDHNQFCLSMLIKLENVSAWKSPLFSYITKSKL